MVFPVCCLDFDSIRVSFPESNVRKAVILEAPVNFPAHIPGVETWVVVFFGIPPVLSV